MWLGGVVNQVCAIWHSSMVALYVLQVGTKITLKLKSNYTHTHIHAYTNTHRWRQHGSMTWWNCSSLWINPFIPRYSYSRSKIVIISVPFWKGKRMVGVSFLPPLPLFLKFYYWLPYYIETAGKALWHALFDFSARPAYSPNVEFLSTSWSL